MPQPVAGRHRWVRYQGTVLFRFKSGTARTRAKRSRIGAPPHVDGWHAARADAGDEAQTEDRRPGIDRPPPLTIRLSI